jgi:Trypsin-like peptidase domain
MLIIRHLTGPLSGREDRIEPTVDRVMFGRQIDCRVSYPAPADATMVARRHFALVRKASGDWTFDLFGAPYVAVNGVAADPGAKLPNGAVIELGNRGGPSFKVLIEADARSDNLPVTKTQAEAASPRIMARWATRIAAIGVVLAIAAGAGAGYYYYRSSSDAARLEHAINGLVESDAREANLRIGSEVRNRLPRSVYLVVLRDAQGREAPHGTAWPVDRHRLGTNAHVAKMREKLTQGETMVVRAPGPAGKIYTVADHSLHPGYDAFANFVINDPPFIQAFRGGQGELGFERVGFNLAAYDVALLRVNEDLPTQDTLELATPDELMALSSGNPLATAGYPMEGIIGYHSQAIRASPEFHVGTSTGLTDFFSLPAEFEQRLMIHHDLPAAGGQSGSPVVGPSGRVLALFNSMNFIRQEGAMRAPSAALINYAQRSDMLGDLLRGEAQAKIDGDQKYWAQQMALFKRGIDVLIPAILAEFKKKNPNADATLVSDQAFTLGGESRVKRQNGEFERLRSHAVPLAGGSDYTFIAYAFGAANIELYLVNGSEILAQTDMKWFQAIAHRPANAGEATLYVMSAQDRDISYALRVYKWEVNKPTG